MLADPFRPVPGRPRTTSRRTLLGGSAAVALAGAVSGCDADLTPGGDPEPGSVAAEVDADGALVEQVRADLLALAAWTADAARRQPRTRPHWAALAAMHRAHARALGPDGEAGGDAADADLGPTPETGRPSPAPAELLRAGRAREQAHQDRLVAAATAAAGGSLARVLAAMAAAVAQRLAAWPGEGGDR